MNRSSPGRKPIRVPQGSYTSTSLRKRRDIILAVIALAALGAIGPLSALFLYASTSGTDPLRVNEYVSFGAPQTEETAAAARSENDDGTVPVFILPLTYNPARAGELRHFLWDGVDRSKRLRRTTDPDEEGVVWMFDVIRFKCQILVPEVKASICRRLVKNDPARLATTTGANAVAPEYRDGNCSVAKFAALTNNTDDVDVKFYQSHRPHVDPAWRVIIMDYTDSGYAYNPFCAEKLSAMLGGTRYVQLATRFHVRNRKVRHAGRKDHQPFHNLGVPMDWAKEKTAPFLEGVPQALHHWVRSDQADFYEEDLGGAFPFDHGAVNGSVARLGLNESGARSGGASNESATSTVLDLPSLPREGDVVFFWNVGSDKEHGSHRDAVARTINGMVKKSNGTLHAHVGTVGQRAHFGRNQVQSTYARELLKYKIVVVCQRDLWEGHYRTMEAFASGALVMTDPMHPMPVYIEDGKSVVVYKSLSELREKITHYLSHASERLEIARRGHEMAMQHHRSWHGLERLVFGNRSNVHGVR